MTSIYAYLNVENPGQIHGQCGHPTGTSQAKGMLSWGGTEAPAGDEDSFFVNARQFALIHLAVSVQYTA